MEDKKTKTVTVAGGYPGVLLAAVIIAVRAFQPNSEPMSSWSVASWLLMTLPILFPLWLYAAWCVAKVIMFVVDLTIELVDSRRR